MRKYEKKDSKQFHQYQQNEQSPLIGQIKTTTTYHIGSPCHGLEQVLECGGVKPDKGIATLSS